MLLVVGALAINGLNHLSPAPLAPTSGVSATTTSAAPLETPSEPPSPPIAAQPAPLISPGTVTRPKTLYVTATSLNVRAAPSAGADVLLKVPLGSKVVAVSQSGPWVEVRLTNGATGWMSGQYLAADPPSAIAEVQPAPVAPTRPRYDRAAVVQAIISASIASYHGNCPCPYNSMRNGRSCGGRSAYSKPGGYAPLCFPQDVTEAMIQDYVARH